MLWGTRAICGLFVRPDLETVNGISNIIGQINRIDCLLLVDVMKRNGGGRRACRNYAVIHYA